MLCAFELAEEDEERAELEELEEEDEAEAVAELESVDCSRWSTTSVTCFNETFRQKWLLPVAPKMAMVALPKMVENVYIDSN